MNYLPKEKQNNIFVRICIIESVCVAAIVIAALIVKLFFDNSYHRAQLWCAENLFEETQITANFDEEENT